MVLIDKSFRMGKLRLPAKRWSLLVISVGMAIITTVTSQSSMCTTDYYRDLPVGMQNEHQCLMLEQFNSEFFNDREDRIRRYKELNIALQDVNYKLDEILSDLDPEEWKKKMAKRTKELEKLQEKNKTCQSSKFKPTSDLLPLQKDCYDLKHLMGINASGVYPIQMPRGDIVLVHCDMERAGGGWTLIQRRIDGSVNFERNWTEYRNGFGNPNTEYWLGLEYLHQMSASKNTSLRVDLWDWDGKRARAEYLLFFVGNEKTNYTLTVSGYEGNTGDSLSYHNGCAFSTAERDNDQWVGNCAWQDGAGWWYKGCSYAALNSKYHTRAEVESSEALDGIFWYHWKETYTYPLPRVEMKIRPANYDQRSSKSGSKKG